MSGPDGGQYPQKEDQGHNGDKYQMTITKQGWTASRANKHPQYHVLYLRHDCYP